MNVSWVIKYMAVRTIAAILVVDTSAPVDKVTSWRATARHAQVKIILIPSPFPLVRPHVDIRKLANGKRHGVHYWVIDARVRLLSTKEA